jgi:hypothetical protein
MTIQCDFAFRMIKIKVKSSRLDPVSCDAMGELAEKESSTYTFPRYLTHNSPDRLSIDEQE